MPKAKPFHFKQFSVEQLASVFKVGTDGVLLGAWVNLAKSISIVDLGCGTGVISLMMAQRNQKAQITAIDLNKEAVELSKQNFQNSPWNKRLDAIQGDLNQLNLGHKFDTIVSNPPYFRNSMKPTSKNNTRSKHDTHFDFEQFSITVDSISQSQSRVSIILPPEESELLQTKFNKLGFVAVRRCNIFPTPMKPLERCMMEFGKSTSKHDCHVEKLIIQNSGQRHDYTDDFVKLMQPFYTIL